MPDSVYYSYGSAHGVLGHLTAGLLKLWRPYCPKCRKYVRVHERMIALGVDDAVLIDPERSDVVKRLRDQDWSVLHQADCVRDWSFQPAIFIALGRCESCDGPFAMSAEVHGKASNGQIYVRSAFTSELPPASGLQLLELAVRKGLLSSDRMIDRAAEYCERIDSAKGARYVLSLRDRRLEGLRLGREGEELLRLGAPDRAQERYMQAFALFNELGDPKHASLALMYLGITDRDRGAPLSAKEHFAAALKRFEEIGDEANATVVRKLLAVLHKEFPELAKTNGPSADG
jgi:tetratricopeptide (TPR) repeat protein